MNRCLLPIVLSLLPAAADAQLAVGYQQQLSAGWAASTSRGQTVRERRVQGVAGDNVQPLGSGQSFDRQSQWELRDPGRPFRLEITEVNPEIRLDQTDSSFRSATVQRSAVLSVTPTGTLAELIPDLKPLPGETLSVFSEP